MHRPPKALPLTLTALLLVGLFLSPGVIDVARDSHIDSLLGHFHDHPHRVLVAAHRGAHNRHPENSLAAIEEAIRLGVDIVELDVRLTRDGIFVLMHDENVKRTTTGRGNLSRMKLEKVKRLYLLGPDGQPTRERVPTLAEALEVADDRIMVDVDFKAGRSADRLVSTISRFDVMREVFVFHPDTDLLAEVKRLNPEIHIMPRIRSEEGLDAVLRRFEAPIFHIDRGSDTRNIISEITQQRGRVWVNVLGKPDKAARRGDFSRWSNVIAVGANVLQTDHPELMLSFLRENNLR